MNQVTIILMIPILLAMIGLIWTIFGAIRRTMNLVEIAKHRAVADQKRTNLKRETLILKKPKSLKKQTK